MSVNSITQSWSAFYDRAIKIAKECSEITASAKSNLAAQQNQRVNETLVAIVKIIFGLDADKKAAVVSYGDGALELIVSLARSCKADAVISHESGSRDEKRASENDSELTILTNAFKAAKACIVLNPVGRSRARSAGVFSWMDQVLTDLLAKDQTNMILVEEIFTTMAAACLGDDLNALQASLQLNGHVDRAWSLASDKGDTDGLKQKITYLRALFKAVSKEQENLVEEFSASHDTFFKNIQTAEKKLREGNKAIQEENFEAAESQYDDALECVKAENFRSETKLLNSLRCQLYWNRANVKHMLGKEEDVLHDIEILLQNEVPTNIVCLAQRLRAKALTALGRDREAKEAIGKALVINPRDEEPSNP